MDTSDYWKKRGKTFAKELKQQPSYVQTYMLNQEKKISNYLKNQKFTNILEIGCGSGRLTIILLHLNPVKILAIDISLDLISEAKNTLDHSSLEFQCVDINNFSNEKTFDLIFSCEVLQHIPFNQIESILEKIIELSNNKIILVECFDEKKVNSSRNDYLFYHDYPFLFKQFENVISYTMTPIDIPKSLKLVNSYAKLRNRSTFEKQVIIEITKQ